MFASEDRIQTSGADPSCDWHEVVVEITATAYEQGYFG